MNIYCLEGESNTTNKKETDNHLLMDEQRPSPKHIARNIGDGNGVWKERLKTHDEFKLEQDLWMEEQGSLGVITSILDSDNNPILMQARKKDQDALQGALIIAERAHAETVVARDLNNNNHPMTLEAFTVLCVDVGLKCMEWYYITRANIDAFDIENA